MKIIKLLPLAVLLVSFSSHAMEQQSARPTDQFEGLPTYPELARYIRLPREELLVAAARDGKIEIVKELLARGWHPDTTAVGHSISGTPLFCAAEQGHLEICELLISRGANVNAINHDYWSSPLMFAKSLEIARLLIANGAKVNLQNKLKRTPLQLQARKGRAEICKLLLDNGANIDAFDYEEQTALIRAVWALKYEVVELLVNRGANVFCKWHFSDGKSWSALAVVDKSVRALDNSSRDTTSYVRIGEPLVEGMLLTEPHQQKARMLCFMWCLKKLKPQFCAIDSNVIKQHFIKALRVVAREEKRGILRKGETMGDLQHESIAYQEVCKLKDGKTKQHLMEKYFSN